MLNFILITICLTFATVKMLNLIQITIYMFATRSF